jgi:hypothetical protein
VAFLAPCRRVLFAGRRNSVLAVPPWLPDRSCGLGGAIIRRSACGQLSVQHSPAGGHVPQVAQVGSDGARGEPGLQLFDPLL